VFSLRHKLSNQCVNDLLKLISFFLPHGSSFPSNTYMLNKELGFDYSTVTNNYYCPKCQTYLGTQVNEPCANCKNELTQKQIHDSGHYFFTFDLHQSISKLLKIKEVTESLQKSFERRKTPSLNMNDITDGGMYKDLKLRDHDLTMCVNTDGVPCFKSSTFSLWPILLTVNELKYSLRSKYVIFGGLWFGSHKPHFNTFFKPFIDQCLQLSSTGISWKLNNQTVQSNVYFPIFVADAPARCQCQGLMQFNGSYSCPWCLIKGENLGNPEEPKSHKWVFPPQSLNQIKNRTHESFLQHIEELNNQLISNNDTDHHFGVKKASLLLLLPRFDIINGFVYDYMHSALLGIARTFLCIWLNPKNHKKGFYIGRRVAEIDRNLLQTLVPFDTQRPVRSLSNRRFWKATEWRTWLLLAPVILEGILPDEFLNHFKMFTLCISQLCSACIPRESLEDVEKKLFRFVKKTQSLYGLEACSFNVHILLHTVDSVRRWGPLFSYSTFI
jgi:hypothetical protein